MRDLNIGDIIQTKDGNEIILTKEYIGRQMVYDIEVDSPEHRYYTNNIISHNTGKTLLSVSVALHKILNEKQYEKVIFLKPTVTAHEDIGFLKGDMKEKLRPFLSSFVDNISVLRKCETLSKKASCLTFDELVAKDIIEIEHIGFIRGRSFNDCIIIADEMQNIGKNVMKTIVTRIGENCKLIALGDIDQIDTPHLSRENNGMSHLIRKFRGQDIFGHVTLVKSERSRVASLAANLL